MTSPSLDLSKLLPPQYRDKTLDTLLKGLFNRHLSKTDVLPLFGHVGDNLDLQPGDVQIRETDLERQINQLAPVIYTEHGTETMLSSWPDLIKKLVLLGVDYQSLDQWFTSKSYNYVPPIDLDKFCNFNQYYWIGEWVTTAPTLPYEELGIPDITTVTETFGLSNSKFNPEFYVIERGEFNSLNEPIAPQPTMTTWSDWALVNLWVHRDDLISFLDVHGGTVSYGQLVQAVRPIIEYSNKIKINSLQTALGVPSDSGTTTVIRKTRLTQLPMFDLYDFKGTHTSQTSAIFYYEESSSSPVDSHIRRRIVTDSNGDYSFAHSLLRDDKELLFYKFYSETETDYVLNTIWRKGDNASIAYSKYDASGTIINQDKFTNYKNYYWIGTDTTSVLASYNPVGLPEYTVIESGGTSDWSLYNYWVHVSQLKRSDLLNYVQAERPIIEFNKGLESQLITSKTELYELPKFQLYAFKDLDNTYEPIPTTVSPNLTDAYVMSHLFARVQELSTSTAILGSPDVLATAFEYNSEYYIQSLYNGEFVDSKNGIVYGYHVREVGYTGAGTGILSTITTDAVCVPQVITLVATSSSNFKVVGSISSFLDLTVGFPYNAGGANFTISSGTTAFEEGDTFVLDLRSYVYNKQSLFVNLGGVYRTLTSPSAILTEKQSSVIVPGDTALLNGIWQIAPQLEWNVQNETRTVVGQGDIYYHLTSIIEAQPGLIGGSSGSNNWRNLASTDVGLGGKIKQFDGNTALLISILLQQGITPATLIEHARSGYEGLFSAIHTFVTDYVPEMLSNAEFTPPISGDFIDSSVVDQFKEYFSNISTVATVSSTTVDDFIANPFYDSTSELQNLVVTLPYMGLAAAVKPSKSIDLELNMNMLVHHDGHRSKLPTVSVDTLKKIVTKNFVRSPGQQTPGLVSGVNPPGLPYKGQFWFKTSTNELWFFNVASDTGDQTSTTAGTYSYNRLLNKLYQFNGTNWVLSTANLNTAVAPWTLIKLDLIEANLILAIEKELFDNCPTLTPRLDDSSLQANTKFDTYQQQEFEKFGIIYGVTDVYGTTYVPTNAFSWNYSSVVIQGASTAHASWQEIYRDVYGTPRPDYQPWISAGYPTETAFLDAYDVYASNPFGTSTTFSLSMWNDITAFMHSRLVLLGRPDFLSVDTTDGSLLAPYSMDIEGLLHTPPVSAASKFNYGDLGPIETYWKKSLNYLYSQQKTYFRLDPLSWVQSTWGIKYEEVGEYVLNSYLKNKESASDFMLHGDLLDEAPQLSWFTTTVSTAPANDVQYSITCVSRLDGIFKVTRSDTTDIVFASSVYSDSTINVEISPTSRGFFWGDGVNLTVHSDGSVTESLVYLKNLRAEGFNQVFVQYTRSYGDDLAISINKSLFSNWTSKLGYRFGGFVNTDTLAIEANDTAIVNSSFNTYIKENKFYNSSWLDALRIQLVQIGSTERVLGYTVPKTGANGTPGEDWIFRVDNYNPSHSKLSWYEFDTDGSYQDFIAMDGTRSSFSWKRYGVKSGVISYNSPFLITGIQNVLNFIFGYADKKADEGWEFNDQNNPVTDASTGRLMGYQLLAEQFVAQQFSGATAGSAFVFNPFSRKVWYKTERGVVSNLFDVLGLEQETVPTLLNSSKRHVPSTSVRVFRQDDITQMVFDEPVYTMHLLTSEYEHVVLFDNYSVDTLIYDPFLGQKAGDVFLEGEKQTVFSGKMNFGGHYLLGDQMKRNIESSVQSILGLYDTTSTLPSPIEKKQARALLGFQNKQYFADRGIPDQTEFRFWQGLIANKGTNFSVDAYVNSQRFKNAKLDEYWAYKLASYGDASSIIKAEMKIESDDCVSEATNYLFLEDDELDLLPIYETDGGYDIPAYGVTPFDMFSLYSDEQAAGMEIFDPRGCTIVQPSDEARWYDYSDLKTMEYFTADVLAEYLLVADSKETIYTILDSRGKPVRADCFEIVDPNFVQSNDAYDMMPFDTSGFDGASQERYYERGEYIAGTNPAEYSAPKFKRINSSMIQMVDDTLLGRPFKVVAYGPAITKYSPNLLVDYQTNTTAVNDIIWWDPARGSHHPAAHTIVDIEQPKDPACYNIGTFSYKNDRLQKQKPWGVNTVGKIWWDTTNLEWQLYSDTKIYPDYNERFARWGAIADFSEMRVNEWVKSSISPQAFEADNTSDGVLGVKYTLKRSRSWYQRIVAWKYSSNPALLSRGFLAYQPSALKVSIASDGYGKVILREGNLASYNIEKGCKISAASYSSTTKTDAALTGLSGQANVISDPDVLIGSLNGADPYEGGAAFVPNADITFAMTVDSKVITFRDNVFGKYQLSNQYASISGKYYITLTHVSSGENQQLQVKDVPIDAGTKDTYNFDQMGIVITYSTNYDRTIGTSTQRIAGASIAIGNPLHDIYLRSYATVFSPIEFSTSLLDGNDDGTSSGWISWIDPSVNPKTLNSPPFNKYEPVLGDWVDALSFLSELESDIKLRTTDTWVGFDETDYSPYKSVWGEWKNQLDTIYAQTYNVTSSMSHHRFFDTYFSITDSITIKELTARADVFINGVKIRTDRWFIDTTSSIPVIRVYAKYLDKGDNVRVQVRKYIPTSSDLAFNPSVSDTSPLVITQWTYDYPCVSIENRNDFGSLSSKSYYFWVRNKLTPATGKSISVNQAAELLNRHDGVYSVPQIFKYYNQLDARPNRYAMLSLKSLSQYVKIRDTYKLRLTRNPTMRDTDNDLSLKNTHVEWKLLRQYQPTILPRTLWDLLTNTLAGETALGETLPFEPRSSYDDRNDSTTKYGFDEQQQLLTDPEIAKATLKYVVLNTKVDKYVSGSFVIDYISYTGFDINKLDDYLSSSTNIRKFMSDLWRYAKPKQLNEIFFAILEDSAASNLELTDFFKTSFIALSDIQTINTDSGTA